MNEWIFLHGYHYYGIFDQHVANLWQSFASYLIFIVGVYSDLIFWLSDSAFCLFACEFACLYICLYVCHFPFGLILFDTFLTWFCLCVCMYPIVNLCFFFVSNHAPVFLLYALLNITHTHTHTYIYIFKDNAHWWWWWWRFDTAPVICVSSRPKRQCANWMSTTVMQEVRKRSQFVAHFVTCSEYIVFTIVVVITDTRLPDTVIVHIYTVVLTLLQHTTVI